MDYSIDIPYLPESNLPMRYAITAPNDVWNQVNLLV